MHPSGVDKSTYQPVCLGLRRGVSGGSNTVWSYMASVTLYCSSEVENHGELWYIIELYL